MQCRIFVFFILLGGIIDAKLVKKPTSYLRRIMVGLTVGVIGGGICGALLGATSGEGYEMAQEAWDWITIGIIVGPMLAIIVGIMIDAEFIEASEGFKKTI
jgi:L-cystine uptake protein TcyP (sodium:dicarboxylate symporter family)